MEQKDKIAAMRKEAMRITEEIETLELVRSNILGYVAVEKVRILIDDFAKTKRDGELQ